jgi:hypothetical protein
MYLKYGVLTLMVHREARRRAQSEMGPMDEAITSSFTVIMAPG